MTMARTPLAGGAPYFEHYDTRATWVLLERDDRTGQILGELEEFSSATLVARFNDVGTFEVQTRLTGVALDMLARRAVGLVIRVGGDTVMSGPVTHVQRTWDDKGDQVTMTGVSDLTWAAMRAIATPEGPRTWAGSVDWVLRNMLYPATVGKGGPNIGILGVPQGNPDCVVTLSWPNCLSAMQMAAAQSSPTYGFDVRDLALETWLPAVTNVIFSAALGTMASFQLTVDRPDANYLYLLGKGWDDGVGEWLTMQDNDSVGNWWRLEEVIDVSSEGEDPEDIYDDDGNVIGQTNPDNRAKYEAAGQAALDQLVKVPAVQVTPIDTPTQQFGLHYGLGDVVTVVLPEGAVITDTVTEVTITLDSNNALTVQPTVGSAQMTLDTFRRLARLDKRLAHLGHGG